MRRTLVLLLPIALLLMAPNRLPAPIQEVQENPPPEQSAKPNPKRRTKPKATSESSESSTRRQTPSPPKNQATPSRNPFDGTWLGTFNGVPTKGDVQFTLTISGKASVVNETSSTFGSLTNRAACDGIAIRWQDGTSSWTLAPNKDEKTAVVTCDYGGFFGIGAYHSSVIFRRTSP
jgi:hypothetical protein